MRLANYQKAFLLDCMVHDRVVGIFARQSGKSTCIAIYALWHCLMIDNTKCLIVSPTQEQSNLLLRKIKDFLNQTPELSKQVRRETATEIEFVNNSSIKSLPVGPDGRCYDEETEILTEEGFKLFFKILTPP